MLRMRKTTDYSLVVLTLYARTGGVRTARAVAEETGISLPMTSKVLKQLGRAGLVRSNRGLCGGYQLARPPEEILLVDVIEALEGPIAVTECGDESAACTHAAACHLSQHWPPINRAIRSALTGIRLTDLAAPHPIETEDAA